MSCYETEVKLHRADYIENLQLQRSISYVLALTSVGVPTFHCFQGCDNSPFEPTMCPSVSHTCYSKRENKPPSQHKMIMTFFIIPGDRKFIRIPKFSMNLEQRNEKVDVSEDAAETSNKRNIITYFLVEKFDIIRLMFFHSLLTHRFQ